MPSARFIVTFPCRTKPVMPLVVDRAEFDGGRLVDCHATASSDLSHGTALTAAQAAEVARYERGQGYEPEVRRIDAALRAKMRATATRLAQWEREAAAAGEREA